jgi:hypothetical protein
MLSFTRRGFPTARAVVGSRWAADVRELVVARGEEAAAELVHLSSAMTGVPSNEQSARPMGEGADGEGAGS